MTTYPILDFGATKIDTELLLNIDNLASPPNTVILLGDSITSQNGITPHFYARGYANWANVILSHRLSFLASKGGSGQRTDQILARVQTDVIDNSPRPGWCFVLAGTNDIGQGVTPATIQSNLQAIFDMLLNAGIRVVAGTIPPRDQASSSTTQLNDTHRVNTWLKNLAIIRKNLLVVDYYGAMVDYTTGWAAPGVLEDGVHPSAQGSALMGKALADLLGPFIPVTDLLLTSNVDPDNLISNGMMTGDLGGGLATGWTVYVDGVNAYTTSKVVRTDGKPGVWQQIMGNGTGIINLHNQNVNVGVDWNVGDQVYAQCEFETDAAGWQAFDFSLALFAWNTGYAADDLFLESAFSNATFRPERGTLRTPVMTVPPGAARLQFKVFCAGNFTIRVSRCEIRKV